LSAVETEEITKNLEENGFDIVPNILAFPDGIDESTLLYSPFVEGENSIYILIDLLNKSGWEIPNIKPIVAGNHYYTKNSVGLLLLPDGGMASDKVTSQDMANDYVSEKCQDSIKLILNSDATYQFVFTNKVPSQIEQLTGSWKITSYPYIELISLNKQWRFYYEIHKSKVTDVVGTIDIIELTPVDEQYTMPVCNFLYGVRA
jgi:hypothetical protein